MQKPKPVPSSSNSPSKLLLSSRTVMNEINRICGSYTLLGKRVMVWTSWRTTLWLWCLSETWCRTRYEFERVSNNMGQPVNVTGRTHLSSDLKPQVFFFSLLKIIIYVEKAKHLRMNVLTFKTHNINVWSSFSSEFLVGFLLLKKLSLSSCKEIFTC